MRTLSKMFLLLTTRAEFFSSLLEQIHAPARSALPRSAWLIGRADSRVRTFRSPAICSRLGTKRRYVTRVTGLR
jgi:hypothetical protein